MAEKIKILFVFVVSFPISKCESCTDCVTQKVLSEQEEIRLKIEWDKLKILNALKLEAPPNLTDTDLRNLPLFPPVINRHEETVSTDSQDDTPAEEEGALKKVFVFGTSPPENPGLSSACTPSPTTLCLSFKLQSDIMYQHVSGGILWVRGDVPETGSIAVTEIVRTKKRRSLSESESESDSDDHPEIIGRTNNSWVALNVSQMIFRWKTDRKPSKQHFLKISCPACSEYFAGTSNSSKALLELETESPKPRNRRNHEDDCRPDLFSSCCLKRLWVSFEELGEKFKFIIQPDGYWANYCTGNCRYGNTGVYGSVVANNAMSKEAKGEKIDENMIPCCAPRKMGSLQLVWVKKPNDIRQHVITDMTVLSCGCDR